MRVTVVGASGEFGCLLSDELQVGGANVVRAHRGSGVDAVTGAGLEEACAGADVVVDATNIVTLSGRKSIAFFSAVAGNIAAAAARADARVVCLSIVHADDPAVNKGLRYYRGKAAQERVYLNSFDSGALTIVKSTQWYSLARQLLGGLRVGRLAVVPHMLTRPADVREVAAAAARIVREGHPKTVVEIAGPDTHDMVDVARALVAKTGERTIVRGAKLAGGVIAGGGLIPRHPDIVTTRTLDDWLADQGSRG